MSKPENKQKEEKKSEQIQKPAIFKVRKRSGKLEIFQKDKIFERLQILCQGLNTDYLDCREITNKAYNGSYDKIETKHLDELAAETAMYMSSKHPDYANLAAKILISNHHKETKTSFYQTMKDIYLTKLESKNIKSHLSDEFFGIIEKFKDVLDSKINYQKDYQYDFFGFKTLLRSYLFKINDKPVERPQHMLMRVSIAIHQDDLKSILETYQLTSDGYFTHASPTLFNAGTSCPQYASCFLLTMKDDSIEGIYDTLKQCSLISKRAGGIGLAVHKIRSNGSYIRGTNGKSDGLVPMLKVFNQTSRYVNQGGRRPGAFAIYLEPWHPDIIDFLNLKKNNGNEERRARDLFYALWIPDEFMRRVKNDEMWSLMCPDQSPDLYKVYGEEFEKLYHQYEIEGKFVKRVPAREIWNQILESQIETGMPYIAYKDAVNRKSNQKNLGTIQCSNLCCEITEYTSDKEIAVCNLASIALPKFVENKENKEFNFEKLETVTRVVTRNLNKIIDLSYYPVKEAEYSNKRNRPIGIGIQGLADTFMKLGYVFGDENSKKLNKDIFETIYYSALSESLKLAKQDGPYESFQGSPASQGILQFDMWNVVPDRYDWDDLKKEIRRFGLRNSLLTACMPTAGTSQILGNSECIEPYMSNIFTRRTMAGEFIIVNRHLVEDLIKIGKWSPEIQNRIIYYNGSVQEIDEIPDRLKLIYKTAFEIKQKDIIDMSIDRGAFICQTQSLNLFLDKPDYNKLTSMYFHGWKNGLKTGQYYLRSRPIVDAIKFGVTSETINKEKNKNSCIDDICVSCSA